MTTAQAHHYGEMPFGVWDTTEDSMIDPRENAIQRLQRPSIAASPAQAEVLTDELGPELINASSDEDLAAYVAAPDGILHNPDQAVIAEILAEVGDDPVKAQVALDAELAGKARVTLLDALRSKVSTPAQESVTAGESGVDDHAGVEPEPVAEVASPASEPAPVVEPAAPVE